MLRILTKEMRVKPQSVVYETGTYSEPPSTKVQKNEVMEITVALG